MVSNPSFWMTNHRFSTSKRFASRFNYKQDQSDRSDFAHDQTMRRNWKACHAHYCFCCAAKCRMEILWNGKACIWSVFVGFSKVYKNCLWYDIVAFRNPYSVKSLKFKHVLFRFVYNNDAASNVKVNEPELLAPFLYSSLFTEMVERNIITQKNNKKWTKNANKLTKQIKSCKTLPITTYDIFWYKPVDIEK